MINFSAMYNRLDVEWITRASPLFIRYTYVFIQFLTILFPIIIPLMLIIMIKVKGNVEEAASADDEESSVV